MSRSTKAAKPYRVKKTGIKDENIDRQILVLHRAMAEKLLRQPDLLPQVQHKLTERLEQGQISYGAYIHWQSVLELYHQPEQFVLGITEDSPYLRKLRRLTPFSGLLTEQERQQVLLADACGELDQVLTGL